MRKCNVGIVAPPEEGDTRGGGKSFGLHRYCERQEKAEGNENITQATLVEQYLVNDRLRIMRQTMDEASSSSRRGSAYTLGIIPDVFITSSNWRAILTSLLEATVPEENPELRDAETRVDAVIASQNILCKLNAKCSNSLACEKDIITISDLKDAAELCLEAFLKGVEDYSVDKRGDVEVASEASMRAFAEVLRCFQTISKSIDDSGVVVDEYETKCTTILGVLLKQCGEKLTELEPLHLRIYMRYYVVLITMIIPC